MLFLNGNSKYQHVESTKIQLKFAIIERNCWIVM